MCERRVECGLNITDYSRFEHVVTFRADDLPIESTPTLSRCAHLGRDVELMTVQCNTLHVRQQILLGLTLHALVGDFVRKRVEFGARLADLACRINDVHGRFEGTAPAAHGLP